MSSSFARAVRDDADHKSLVLLARSLSSSRRLGHRGDTGDDSAGVCRWKKMPQIGVHYLTAEEREIKEAMAAKIDYPA